MGLIQEDQKMVDERFNTMLNYTSKVMEYRDKFVSNAQNVYTKIADTVGWDGLYKQALASGDPTAIDRINKTFGNGFNLKGMAAQPNYQQMTEKLKYQTALNEYKSTLPGANATTPSEIDTTSKSILAQTGLSYNAFLVLTGKMSALPRDAATRNAASKEAANFANTKGVDVSTMISQYEALNDTLESNTKRYNSTKIMENEILGTVDNLQNVVNQKDLGKVRMNNVIKIWAGQEVNDPLAQQYAMHLYQLREELAAYAGALQGRTGNNITDSDRKQADLIIKNGVSSGSLQGLKSAVESSTSKMGSVLQGSIDSARQGVWDLFGVGANYKGSSKASTTTTTPNFSSATTSGLKVTVPGMGSFTFPDMNALNAFKKDNNIK